jgi:2-(1,2-epoxy-1,2-dihydrophenyl)acetyl-CoA isomerase
MSADRVAPLRLERDAGVALITIDRPEKKNAFTAEMWSTLADLIEDVAADRDDRVLVITGTADAFSAGADLTDSRDKASGDEGPLGGAQTMREIHRGAAALTHLAKPSVAAVNGVAAGAGMNLALGCDVVFAAESARFTEIFVRRGLSVDYGGTWLLPRIVGLQRAKDLAMTGRMVSAAEALDLGLVLEVVPDAEILEHAMDYARELASLPPVPLSLIKHGLDTSFGRTMDEALEYEARAQATCFATHDLVEAFQAWAEKRPGTYHGR